jgi:alkylhydroperoxidase family enzyme
MTMTRVLELSPGETELEQVWSKRPEYFSIFIRDYEKSLAGADPIHVELVRLRIAEMVESAFDLGLRYRPAQEAGLTAEKIAALGNYLNSPLYTDADRVVLDFVEQWVIQSSAITDADTDRMQSVMTPEQFMFLCKAMSVIDQFARANSAFRIGAPSTVPSQLPSFVLAS